MSETGDLFRPRAVLSVAELNLQVRQQIERSFPLLVGRRRNFQLRARHIGALVLHAERFKSASALRDVPQSQSKR